MASTWRPDVAAAAAAAAMATTRKASKIAKLQGYVVRGVTGSFRSTLSNEVSALSSSSSGSSSSTKRSQIRLVRPTVASKFSSRTTLNASGITTEPSATNWTSTLADLFNSTATAPGNVSTPDPFMASNWFTSDPSGSNFTCATLNDTDYSNVTCRNGTHAAELGPKDYWALLLFLFPILTVFGNVLVILSVYRERALQSATNYFIISLAIADLLVATLVMPFAVYAMVNGEWGLPAVVCDFYIAMDVTSSTSSIFNLVAISIDRYIAVTQPIKYARHKNHKRVWLTIGLVWLISAAIGSPIVLGLNHTPIRDPTMCMFYNYDFVIYSSLSSFYIPCIIMVVLYYQIFKAIRERAKKAAAKKQPHNSHIMDNMAPHTKRLAETALGGPVIPAVSVQAPSSAGQQQRASNSVPVTAPATISGSTPGDLGALPTATALSATKHTLLGRAASSIKASKNKHLNNSTNKRSLFEDDKTTEGSGSQDDDEDDDRDDDEQDGSCGFEADNGTGYHHHHLHHQQTLPRDGSCDYILAAAKKSDPTVAAVAVSSAVLAPTATCGKKSSGNGSSALTNGANQQQEPPSPPQASSDSLASGGGRRESQRNKGGKRGNVGRSSSGGGDSVDKESKQHQSAGSRFTIYKVNKASRKKREKSSAKKERKATKTLAIVLGVFLICWVPFFTCNIMDAICSKLNRDCQPGVTAFLLTTWLGYVNSFINPVIYTIFNLEFRKAFKRILTCAD